MSDPEQPRDLLERLDALEKRVEEQEALEKRVVELEALERRVEELEALARERDSMHAPTPSARDDFAPVFPVREPSRRPTIRFGSGGDPGQWVNRLGIALLLLGAAFGFKYSIDRGWIGPGARVLAGIASAVVLLLLSRMLRLRRPGLSRVLAGGGIAAAYLSIYAGFQLYELMPHGAAFASMCVVTVIAFVLAMRDDEAMIATLGAIGGLATPFLLYSGNREVGGLVAYTCLVVAGAGAIFAQRGWRALLWTVAIGGWLVMASAAFQVNQGAGDGAVATEIGIVFLALATWWLAVMRELLAEETPERWRPASFGFGSAPFSTDQARSQTGQLVIATPVLVMVLSDWTWQLDDRREGWIALLLALGWTGAAVHLRVVATDAARRLSSTHLVAAAVMLAFATAWLAGSDARRFGLAAEALAILVVGERAGDRRATVLGHLLFAWVASETYGQIVSGFGDGTPHPTALELSTLAVVACLGSAARIGPSDYRPVYFVAAQTGFLLWLDRFFEPFPNGTVLVTAAWFLDAIALVVAGLASGGRKLRRAGGAVMALTMAKLFVFDLATVDALWRIVTFLGFGIVLLALGYAFPAMWRSSAAQNDESS